MTRHAYAVKYRTRLPGYGLGTVYGVQTTYGVDSKYG